MLFDTQAPATLALLVECSTDRPPAGLVDSSDRGEVERDVALAGAAQTIQRAIEQDCREDVQFTTSHNRGGGSTSCRGEVRVPVWKRYRRHSGWGLRVLLTRHSSLIPGPR